MRFGLIDLLIGIFFTTVGAEATQLLHRMYLFYLMRIAVPACAVGLYLAVAAPIYRRFRLFPLILPRCPCCGKFQNGFYITHGWPRVAFLCPTCKGEFIIWLNGKPGDSETWDRPVLALKWPYVFGRYRRKKLLPNLRRFIVDCDLRVSDGRVALNIISSPVTDAHEKGKIPNTSADRGGTRGKP
jgi:hypothetical protein